MGRGRGRVSSARQAWDGRTSAGGTCKSTRGAGHCDRGLGNRARDPCRPSPRSGPRMTMWPHMAEGAVVTTRPGERGAGRAHGVMTQIGSKFQMLSTQVGQSLTQGKLRKNKGDVAQARLARSPSGQATTSLQLRLFPQTSFRPALPKGAPRGSSLPLCPACRAPALGALWPCSPRLAPALPQAGLVNPISPGRGSWHLISRFSIPRTISFSAE